MWKISLMFIVLFFFIHQIQSLDYCKDDQKTVAWADFLAHTFIVHGFSHRGKDFSQEPPPHADISFPNVQAYAKPYNPFVHATLGEFVFPHQCSWECRMSALVAPAAQYLPRMMLGNVQDLLLANIRTAPIDLSKTAMLVPQWMGNPLNEDKQYTDLKKMATDNGVKIVTYPAYEECTTLLNVPLSSRNAYSHYHPGPNTPSRKTIRQAVEDYVKSQGNWWIQKCPDDDFDYKKKRFDYMPWEMAPYEKLCVERTPTGAKSACMSVVTTPWYYVGDLRVHAQSIFNPIHTVMSKDGDKSQADFCPADKKSNFYLVRSKSWTKTIRLWIEASSAKNDENGKPIGQASYDHLNNYKKRLTEYGFVADLYCATLQYAKTERAKEAALKDAALATQKLKTRACTKDTDLSIKNLGDYLASGAVSLDFLGMFATPAFASRATRPKVAQWPVNTPYDPNDRPKTSFFKHNPKTFGYFLEQLAITRCALDPAHIPTRPVPAPPVVAVVPQVPQVPPQQQQQQQPQQQAQPQAQPAQLPPPPPVVQQQASVQAPKSQAQLDFEREQEEYAFEQEWGETLEDDWEVRTIGEDENAESLDSFDLWFAEMAKDLAALEDQIKKWEEEEAAELLKQQQQQQQESEQQQHEQQSQQSNQPPPQQKKASDGSSSDKPPTGFTEIRQKFKERRNGQLAPDYDEE